MDEGQDQKGKDAVKSSGGREQTEEQPKTEQTIR